MFLPVNFVDRKNIYLKKQQQQTHGEGSQDKYTYEI